MLASAEVVPGKNVTCFFSIKDDLVHAGANYRDAEVVVDGNLITSRQPGDLPAFCQAIIAGLGGEVAVPACQMVLYGGHPWDLGGLVRDRQWDIFRGDSIGFIIYQQY